MLSPGRGRSSGRRPPRHSTECAIHALAPTCGHCGIKVIGHGIEAGDAVYCCAHCTQASGVEGARDRVEAG